MGKRWVIRTQTFLLLCFPLWDHLFSTYATFSGKLTFLTLLYAHLHVNIYLFKVAIETLGKGAKHVQG